ncbi:sensor histidine kinase [Paenibacillus sp. IB182496]|uniref:Sensor histidine kinase n=1 Tax=Paenibacillus sabuli TaxID=2772509 RepID=A0A927BVE5_9BACL|nr:sensor histidine kinase [Paenibacillus sabuli]MBD2847057.1 sensor histidine kinase [Paenibacillus sabuli]
MPVSSHDPGNHTRTFSLRTRFLFAFMLLLCIVLATSSLFNYYISIRSIKTMSAESSTLLLNQIARQVEQSVVDLEDLTFQEYERANFCSVMVQQQGEGVGNVFMAQAIKQFLYRMVYAYNIFPYAMIEGLDGTVYRQMRLSSTVNPALDAYQLTPERRTELIDRRGQTVWSPGDQRVVLMQRAMYDPSTSAYCGTLVVGVDTDFFRSMYPGSAQAGEIMFANRRGELLIYGGPEAAQLYEEAGQGAAAELTHGSKRYIVTDYETSDGRWRLLNAVPLDQLTRWIKELRYWAVVIFAVALAAAFVHADILSRYITKRLNRLVRSMKNLSLGVLDTVMPSDSRDEIGVIAERFNIMAVKIQELIYTASQEKLQKERAEYKRLESEYVALQAQMNPHFLYNTLESIHGLARLRGEKEIGQMIYLLGRLMRSSLGRKQKFIPLEEEIQLIRDYLTLQSITYEDRLQVEYEIEERALQWTVPKLILQPILENAIVHGIEEKPGVGHIAIRCREEGADLVMEVEDNGVGMSEAQVAALLAGDEPEPSGRTRVGVRSVHMRIQLLFGERYGIDVRSRLNEGTRIRIRMPKAKGELSIGSQSHRH